MLNHIIVVAAGNTIMHGMQRIPDVSRVLKTCAVNVKSKTFLVVIVIQIFSGSIKCTA